MRRRKRQFLAGSLSVMLAVTCMSSPVQAYSYQGSNSSFWDWVNSTLDKLKNDETVDLTVMEDETTVMNGDLLRASTYAAPEVRAVDEIKYFPVTMYDYDDRTMRNATHQIEVEKEDFLNQERWEGIYFGGAQTPDSYKYGEKVSETYGVVNRVTYKDIYNGTTNTVSLTNYYYQLNPNEYYPVRVTVSSQTSGIRTTYTYTFYYEKNGNNVQFDQASVTSSFLNDGRTANYTKNRLYTKNTSTEELITKQMDYEGYDYWTGNSEGDPLRVYDGLAKTQLDANKNIVFNVPEAGLFTKDTKNKKVYTNVGLPFEYDRTSKYYTFDSDTMSARFDGGTAKSNVNLVYKNSPQLMNRGGKSIWLPYNSGDVVSSSRNYYFGMAATIPFTMTADGYITEGDKTSDKINFEFSGDDDVWIFVDGQLVLDLGGIHDKVGGNINFADNLWKYDTGVSKVSSGSISGKLFNDAEGEGLFKQSLESFAAKETHELSIYYMERGAGESNCKIRFNLPMKDFISVNKTITKNSDGNPLTEKQQAEVDEIDFGFVVMKDGKAVANKRFNKLNKDGQVIDTLSTDANGHFTLKNGQTARFVGDLKADGSVYKVIEDKDEGFIAPTWNYSGEVADGFNDEAGNQSPNIPATVNSNESTAITANGSSEAKDTLFFTCENFLKAEFLAKDDRIVIDYGLPVEIDVLRNDVTSGAVVDLQGIGVNKTNDELATKEITARFGNAKIENGKVVYTLEHQLTDVEVLTYTLKKGNEYKNAYIYIIPATSMYYEEDFSNLITYTNAPSSSWTSLGTKQSDKQEPGVVGTIGDSPYGSDAAYLTNQGDSYGTSMGVSTTSGVASFSYSFTGTGTSFFARTSANTATMRVVVKDKDNNVVKDLIRNTAYKAVDEQTEKDTLYNIPVFTFNDVYGTYTVEVTVLKEKASFDRGGEFYLDGIKVVNPLFSDVQNDSSLSENQQIGASAYAEDGEANNTVETLREKLLLDATTTEDGNLVWSNQDQELNNFVLFTDSNGEIISAAEYKSNGPKEEVYLNDGQSITFSLYDWDPDSNRIYLGMKAPSGSGSVTVNGDVVEILNTVDCYYDIKNMNPDIKTDENGIKTATFKIQATSSLISLTNIKVTGNAKFTIIGGDSKFETMEKEAE